MIAPRALNPHALGPLPGPLTYLPETDSTNTQARLGALAGAPWGSVWVAEAQTAGRGRDGRQWQTFPYDSLAFSILLPALPPTLPLVASLSVVRAVKAVTGRGLQIKWPNDLRRQGLKVGGILTEGFRQPQPGLVVGIGLNINPPATTPEGLEFHYTTLGTGLPQPLPREEVLAAIINQLWADSQVLVQQGFGAFYDDYVAACDSLGQTVTWRTATHQVSGLAAGLDASGALSLRQPDGTVVLCRAGDIIQPGPDGEGAPR